MSTIFILLIMTLVFWYLSRNKKRDQERRQAQRDAAMVPGTWMVTTAGYYGRFVDRDGDVVILENLDGQETLWSLRAIVGPSEPPFAQSLPEDTIPTETSQESEDAEAGPQPQELDESADQTVLSEDDRGAEKPVEAKPAAADRAGDSPEEADGAAADAQPEADSEAESKAGSAAQAESEDGENPDQAEAEREAQAEAEQEAQAEDQAEAEQEAQAEAERGDNPDSAEAKDPPSK